MTANMMYHTIGGLSCRWSILHIISASSLRCGRALSPCNSDSEIRSDKSDLIGVYQNKNSTIEANTAVR